MSPFLTNRMGISSRRPSTVFLHGYEYPLNDVLEQNPKVFRLGVSLRPNRIETMISDIEGPLSRICGEEGGKENKTECICIGRSHLQEALLSYRWVKELVQQSTPLEPFIVFLRERERHHQSCCDVHASQSSPSPSTTRSVYCFVKA